LGRPNYRGQGEVPTRTCAAFSCVWHRASAGSAKINATVAARRLFFNVTLGRTVLAKLLATLPDIAIADATDVQQAPINSCSCCGGPQDHHRASTAAHHHAINPSTNSPNQDRHLMSKTHKWTCRIISRNSGKSS